MGPGLHQLFETQASRTPEAGAIVCEEDQLTYRELNGRANQLAHHLQNLGVGPEVFVGLFMEPSVELVVCVLGILKAGGACVPLEPDYPFERISCINEETHIRVMVTQKHLLKKILVVKGFWKQFSQMFNTSLVHDPS